MIATTNINCSGRAFHCVNSTHFMICVDLGGGVSTTIDDFVIPCPATTVCHENNIFECDFPEVVTTPPLEVVGVYKQSDTSEPTIVTNSVTPTSDIFSVFKENITATTLPTPEDVTPVVKLEVLENIKDSVGVNIDNSTDTSFKVTFSIFDTTNEIVNDKQASNVTISTSTTDNNKTIAPTVETSIPKTVNTSLTDKSVSNDTITSVIGLINLISADAPIVVNTKPPSEVLTSLDSSFDTIAATTEQYNTKEVIILGERVENATDKINIPTEAISTESSVIPNVVNTTRVENNIENINKTDINNQNITEKNTFIKSNITIALVPETTKAPVTSAQSDNISEPVTAVDRPQIATENTLVPLGIIDLITTDPKQSVSSTNVYINTLSAETAKTNDQFTDTVETTLSEKPVAVEVISTTPIINTAVENVLKSDINNISFIELNSTTTNESVPVIKINDTIPEPLAEGILQTTTEHTLVPITTVAIMNTTETVTISEVLFNNDSLIENQTVISQPLNISIATDLPIVVTDNLSPIKGGLNQTLITTKNTTFDIINTTDKENTVFNVTSKNLITEKSAEHALSLPTNMKDPALEITTAGTLLNVVSPAILGVTVESPVVNVSSNFNESNLENVKTANTTITNENDMTVFNTSTTVFNSSGTESTFTTPTTIKYPTIELSTTETLKNDFVTQAAEVKNESPATNGPLSVNESKQENDGTSVVLDVHTTPATYNETSDSVTDTLAMDLISQIDIATDQQTETIAHKPSYVFTAISQGTTQKTNAVSESPNQLESSGTIDDKNTSLSDIVESIKQDSITATDVANAQHVVLKPILSQAPVTVDYLTELASTTPKTVQTAPIGIESTTSGQISSQNPVIVDLYKTSTTHITIETSTTFSVDVTHTIKVENIPDIPIAITTLPPHELNNQTISTVQQLNTTTSPTETVSNSVFTTVTTAGYGEDNITNLNTANIDPVSSKVESNADVNKTETANPITGKNNDNATSFGVNTNKDNNIKIVSVLDVVNTAENATLSGTKQPSSLNPSLSNDYITTTASQDSSAYVTATDNVSNYNLVHNESVSQKKPEATGSFTETKITNSAVSIETTLPVIETSTEKVQYVSTEAKFPSKVDSKPANPTNAIVGYVTEKANDYLPTEAMLSQVNKLPNVQAVTLPKAESVTPDTVVIQDVFTIASAYDEFTTIKDSAFTLSPTQISLGVVTDSNIIQRTESPLLTLKVGQSLETSTVNYNEESSSPILELPVAQITIEPTHATILTTPSAVNGLMNQEVVTGIKTTVLPQDVMSSLPVELVTAAQNNSETTYTTTYAQTTPSTTTSQMNQDVLTELKSTDLPQYVMPTMNNNISQSVPSLPTTEVTSAQIISEPTSATIFVQTLINQDVLPGLQSTELPQYDILTVNNNNPQPIPSLAAAGVTISQTTPLMAAVKTNQDEITEMKTTELPQYVIPTVGNNNQQSTPSLPLSVSASKITTEQTINVLTQNATPEIKTTDLPQSVTRVTKNSPQPMPSLVTAGESASQITTGPTHTSKVFAKTSPFIPATGKTNQDVQSGIITLPQYVTTTVTYKNPQSISDITTETVVDSLTAPDSMVETINVVGDKITETIPSTIAFTSPTAIKADHESIVIGAITKSTKSVDLNRAEIVNYTESNWMPSDVNIDNFKIKQSSVEEADSKSTVSKSGTDVQNKTKALESSIKTKIELKDVTPADKIEFRPTIVTTNYNVSKSGSLNNASQTKTVTTKNKKTEINSSANANIEIIDVKKYHIPVVSNTVSNSNNINNTKANITTSHYNLSQQNSTINDELEQHLVSTNHTITAEVQSHLNESDKQSNKTRDELTVNGTIHNPDLTSIKLNSSSKDTSVITVPASVFNCTNLIRGKYADKKDCRKFYTCIGNLQPILGTCPNNTVFSEINKQCTRNLSHCVRNNQFRCLFEGRFSDFFKDNIYYICVKNRMDGFIRYKLQCQADYHLNKDSVKCEKNEELSTQSVSSVSETNNDESKPKSTQSVSSVSETNTNESKSKPKSEKMVSTDDFECESEGKFPYAKDCNKYYVCSKVKTVYRRKIKKCPSEEVFDKEKKKCVESDSGEC